MSFVWSKSEVANMSATLYETNITLNRAACIPFKEYRYVLLGYDKDLKQIAIKPISKEDYDLNIYPRSQIHKFSLGKSYGRISNKTFMKLISDLFNLNYQNGIKFDTYFDESLQMMIIEL